jgi:hypothetical protein
MRTLGISLDPDAKPSSFMINAQGGDYGNALQAASTGGHERVVRLLLDGNADVHVQGSYCGSALRAVEPSLLHLHHLPLPLPPLLHIKFSQLHQDSHENAPLIRHYTA